MGILYHGCQGHWHEIHVRDCLIQGLLRHSELTRRFPKQEKISSTLRESTVVEQD